MEAHYRDFYGSHGGAHIHEAKPINQNVGLGFLSKEEAPGHGVPFSQIAGAYSPATRTMGINLEKAHGSIIGVGPHEFGHLIDHALAGKGPQERASYSNNMFLAARDLNGDSSVRSYYRPQDDPQHAVREIFGETFPAYLKAKNEGRSPAIAVEEGLKSHNEPASLNLQRVAENLTKEYDRIMKEAKNNYG